jgi:hypothetical protein
VPRHSAGIRAQSIRRQLVSLAKRVSGLELHTAHLVDAFLVVRRRTLCIDEFGRFATFATFQTTRQK